MTAFHRNGNGRPFMIIIACFLLLGEALSGNSFAQSSTSSVHAYYIQDMPAVYKQQESLIAALKDTGANAIILDLPLSEKGFPVPGKLHNSVYLAHQAGLQVHVILPTRRLPGILSQHNDWQDARYDVGSGTVESIEKLDLFNNAAVEYLTALAKEIASYSIDALLLGADFYYSPVEGIGRAAGEQAVNELKWAPDPRQLFKKVSRGPDGPIIEEYGDQFTKWTSLKRDRLQFVFEQIRKAGRSVNSGLKIGIPIPIVMPVPTESKVFTQFAYDMNAYRKLNCDYYWALIAYRDIRSKQNLTYRQTMEQLSRMAHSAVTTVKLPNQVIIALQATSENGTMIPMFEMEEITLLAKNAGSPGIAYIIGNTTAVNRTFMKKIFNGPVKP